MIIDRRNILKYILTGGLFLSSNQLLNTKVVGNISKSNSFEEIVDTISFKKNENINLIDSTNNETLNKVSQKKLLPKGLKKGSKIGIVAPASHANIWEFGSFIKIMNKLGLEVVIGETIKNYNIKYRYFSAPDEVRANELMEFFKRNDIDAIITARGGYGVLRILHLLDFKIICNHPKILIGFSDITALLNAIYHKCNLITFHGPAAISDFNNSTLEFFIKMLFETTESQELIYQSNELITLNEGISRGELVGGNLTMLASTIGTEYEINTENKILFFEDISEQPYQIDRKLTQLFLSGKFNNLKGVIVGKFKNYNQKYYFYPNLSYTVKEVIENRLKELNVPILLNAPFGHTQEKWIFPIGINAEMNTEKKYIKILEKTII